VFCGFCVGPGMFFNLFQNHCQDFNFLSHLFLFRDLINLLLMGVQVMKQGMIEGTIVVLGLFFAHRV
jgi:hypothetical protein